MDTTPIPRDDLDRALAASLPPPVPPSGLRAALRQAIAHEAPHRELAADRGVLEAEYQRRLATLERGWVRVRLDTLVTALAAAFTAGAVATALAPWFERLPQAAGPLAPLLLGATALGVGAWALRRRRTLLRGRRWWWTHGRRRAARTRGCTRRNVVA